MNTFPGISRSAICATARLNQSMAVMAVPGSFIPGESALAVSWFNWVIGYSGSCTGVRMAPESDSVREKSGLVALNGSVVRFYKAICATSGRWSDATPASGLLCTARLRNASLGFTQIRSSANNGQRAGQLRR